MCIRRAWLLGVAVLLSACVSGPPRGVHHKDRRGRLALLTMASQGNDARATSLVELPDGELAFSARAGHGLRVGGVRLGGPSVIARLRPDGRVRWARGLGSAHSHFHGLALAEPQLIATSEGELSALGVFQGNPTAPGEAPQLWPLSLRAIVQLDADGHSLYPVALDDSKTSDEFAHLLAVTDLGNSEFLLALRREDTFVIELRRHQRNEPSTTFHFHTPQGPAPRSALFWRLLLASARLPGESGPAAFIAGGTARDVFLTVRRAPAEEQVPPIALPGGAFLARLAPYRGRAAWVVRLPQEPEGLVVARNGTVVVHTGTSVSALSARTGEVLWSRQVDCMGQQNSLRLRADPTRDAVVLGLHPSGACAHGLGTIAQDGASEHRSSLFLRLSLQDGHTEAVSILTSTPSLEPGMRGSGHASVADFLVNRHGDVMALGHFEGRLVTREASAESHHGHENRCTRAGYAGKPGCGHYPFEKGALFLARVPWEPSRQTSPRGEAHAR